MYLLKIRNKFSERQRILLLLLFCRIVIFSIAICLPHNVFMFGYEVSAKLEVSTLISITLFQLFLLSKAEHKASIGGFQLLTDIFLLTWALSVVSTYAILPLYLLLVACGAFAITPYYAVGTAAFSGICYALLITGVIGQNHESTQSVNSVEILISYISIITCAIFCTYFSNKWRSLKAKVSLTETDIERLTLEQSTLLNNLNEGIITLDLRSAITGMNEAARAILGLTEVETDQLLGTEVKSALTQFGIKGIEKEFYQGLNTESEFQIFTEDDHKTVKCSKKTISNTTGNATGSVLFLSDVSELKYMEDKLSFHEKITNILSKLDDNVSNNDGKLTNLIGTSLKIQEISKLVVKVASSNVPVLIQGESGTGKEVAAKAIHKNSARSNKPFITVNCGAIPENLIESELFGFKKGAFTGADRDSQGLFREAQSGTIFLDEIGELPLHLQAKLLRVIQSKVVKPLGASNEVDIDVRIVAATNRDLAVEVKEGRFREDLFYRLRVIEIQMPALRERTEDIPLLINRFLADQGFNLNNIKITPETFSLLLNYNYPGNVRELENIVLRGLALGSGSILPEYLPEEVRFYKKKVSITDNTGSKINSESLRTLPVDLDSILQKLEKEYLMISLAKTEGRKKEAAKLLGMNFRSFRYRLKKYEMDEGSDVLDDSIEVRENELL